MNVEYKCLLHLLADGQMTSKLARRVSRTFKILKSLGLKTIYKSLIYENLKSMFALQMSANVNMNLKIP